MFEDGARIDDILNVLKKPTLDKNKKKKKTEQFSDTAIRYEIRQSTSEDFIKYDFAQNMSALR